MKKVFLRDLTQEQRNTIIAIAAKLFKLNRVSGKSNGELKYQSKDGNLVFSSDFDFDDDLPFCVYNLIIYVRNWNTQTLGDYTKLSEYVDNIEVDLLEAIMHEGIFYEQFHKLIYKFAIC